MVDILYNTNLTLLVTLWIFSMCPTPLIRNDGSWTGRTGLAVRDSECYSCTGSSIGWVASGSEDVIEVVFENKT